MAVDLTNRLALIKPRGGSSGSAPAEPVDIDQLNSNADKIDQYIGTSDTSSTTRPAGVFAGQMAFETDTTSLIRFDGTSWSNVSGEQVNYNTVATGITGWTQQYGFYIKTGKMVTVFVSVKAASTGSPTATDPQFSLPFNPTATPSSYGNSFESVGSSSLVDISAGSTGRYIGYAYLFGSRVRVGYIGTNGQTLAGVPFTVGNNDVISWQISYPVAG